MKYLLSLLLLFILNTGHAQPGSEINLVPAPVTVKLKQGTFTLDKNTLIVAPGLRIKDADFFNNYLSSTYAVQLDVVDTIPADQSSNLIILSVSETGKRDGYVLDISANKITVTGNNDAGVFYGVQTLLQLFPMNQKVTEGKSRKMVKRQRDLPQLTIYDYPRFNYRGMHLDCSRHFWDTSFVKKYIDYLAWHKFNTFHWHLTDDQGWRVEIKKYPLLTSVGGWRNGTITERYPGTGNDRIRYGGYYSQDEIAEIVKYAADRYINIIPEIELPGHASAAIAAYPELSCFPDEPTKIPPQSIWNGPTTGKQVQQTWGVFTDVFCPTDYTFKFIEDVLTEVMRLFPSKYIHIGGDECPKDNWKRSDFCQKLIKKQKLKDEHDLQSYFIQRVEKFLNKNGRLAIGWEEVLEGDLKINATIMGWQGDAARGIRAARENRDVIMTPQNPLYFDHKLERRCLAGIDNGDLFFVSPR